ncbi:NAD+ synthase [Halococcus thailandensis]|uniref:NH(3)-dependent NAD(+) synthetase n=1 Tax=Halococcus thailandensis JCM 13552 TaxID=1227457 RepID=M0NA90_9EURY|nr:NAD+ synthase [Halococcus thailandensis]EMA53555.1 NAD synthetase [Halococcus thailandensis JCM 13552]
MADTQPLATDVPFDLSLSADELDAHRERITDFVAERVEAAGATGGVLGISGGIDSTLTAYLAAEALGTDGLHGLVLPSEVNSDENMSDAERVAEDLGIDYDVLAIEPIVESFLDAFPDAGDEESERTAVGNLRVRVRAVCNYYLANRANRLVLGTGNRTESLVGYFTKYGDGAVDCHPIGNLYKLQVRQLARHVGVPDDLVDKTPTAGMWVGQTDEEELGIGYDTLDAILALRIDGPLSRTATARELGIDEDTVEHVEGLVARSEHKRHTPPAPAPLTRFD